MKEKDLKGKSKTDWDRLKKMSDDEIDFSEVPKLKEGFFKKAKLRMPKAKPLISIRVDHDVLSWFKAQGEGYQTRMNAVLRMYMESQE